MKNFALLATLAIGAVALADTHTIALNSAPFTKATNVAGHSGSLSVSAQWLMSGNTQEWTGSAFFTTPVQQPGLNGSRTVQLLGLHTFWRRDGIVVLEGRGLYRLHMGNNTVVTTGDVRVIVNDQKRPGTASALRDRFTVRFWGDGGQDYYFDGLVTSGDLRISEIIVRD